MSKKKQRALDVAASLNAPSGAYYCVPTLILCALAPVLIIFSFQKYWFPEQALRIFAAMNIVGVAASALLALVVLVWPWARRRVLVQLEGLGQADRARRLVWLAASYLGLFALLYFLKYCQYRGFQLTMDTTATANIVYNAAHSGTLASSIWGVPSYLAIHFMPAIVSWAPFLLLWNDLQVLMILQTLLVASVPVAAYLLAYRRSNSAACGWSALWMVLTSPFFFNIVATNIVFQAGLPAFFLWGAYCVETQRWKSAALCAVMLILTIEETPVLFFGLGIYLLFKLGVRTRRAWLAGGGVCLGSLILFVLEWRLIHSYPRGGTMMGASFSHLAPTLPALALRMAQEPLSVARHVIFPLENLRPIWGLIASSGGAFLLSPLEIIPWTVNFIPHLLSVGYYHDLRLHYSAYVVGPYWWAVALGLARGHLWLERKNRAYLLVIFALLLGARNLYFQPLILLKGWNRYPFSEVPALLPLIPPKAGVWAPEFISPQVSCRPFVWAMLPGSEFSTPGLFVPDYVLLQREYAASMPLDAGQTKARDTLLTFLAQEKYVKVSERWSVILLKHPRAPLVEDGGRPPLFQIPKIDAKAAAAYAAYLARHESLPETAQLFLKIAEQGDEEAQYNLGVTYSQGQGVPKDADAATKWWTKAAEQGVADAQNNLGIAYMERGDWASAASWLRMGAEQGNTPAQFDYALCLLRAPAPIHDEPQANFWLRKAAAQGYEAAKSVLAQLGRNQP